MEQSIPTGQTHTAPPPELQPVLEDIMQERKRLRDEALLWLGVIAVCAVIGLLIAGAVSFVIGTPLFWFIIGIIVVAVAAGIFVTRKPQREYRQMFKHRVIKRLVEIMYPDITYQPEGHISAHEFRESGIYQRDIDRYRGEDWMEGMIGSTDFRFSEIHAEYKTESSDSDGDRKTQWHTIFKGIFFIADFHKHFQGTTYVLVDKHESFLGGFGQMLQKWGGQMEQRGELVRLEDPEFEKLYAVYSDDQVEARYILSTSLMRRLVQFRQQVGDDVALAFLNSKVYIAISTNRNYFEPPSLWSSRLISMEDMRQYMGEVRLAENVIEDLNLNTRIWTKE